MKLFLALLIFPLCAWSEIRAGYGVGSYLGRHQLQLERISKNQKHHVMGVLGYTSDRAMGDIRQLGLTYVYGFEPNLYKQMTWVPFAYGGFITYTDNTNYYVTSPKKYKNDAYYDMASLRFGLRFASLLTVVTPGKNNIHFALDGSFMEKGLINYFNNPSEFGILKAYWSLGVSVRFDWPTSRSAP